MQSVSIDLNEENQNITLPDLGSYSEPANVTYSTGDFFRYQSDEDPDLSLDMILLETGEFPSGQCDDSKFALFLFISSSCPYSNSSFVANRFFILNSYARR